MPSGEGRLSGKPVKINPNDSPENIRALTRQNESAQTLSRNGYKIEQLKEKPPAPGVKQPDYKVEGKVFDHYAPDNPRARNIASTLQRKIEAGQADRFVVSLDDTPVSVAALREQLTKYPTPGLKEVLAVKDGKVVSIYP